MESDEPPQLLDTPNQLDISNRSDSSDQLNLSSSHLNLSDLLDASSELDVNNAVNISDSSSDSSSNSQIASVSHHLNTTLANESNNNPWANVPDIFLEQIFLHLSLRDRHSASQVCWNWYHVFNSSYIWSSIVVHDKTLTRRKYNYYLGYQHQLDHYRVQLWLHKFGRDLRRIIITPMSNFYNLYELIKMLTQFAQYFDQNPLSKVNTFDFTFNCRFEKDNEKELIFGTGGTLFKGLKKLLSSLPGKCVYPTANINSLFTSHLNSIIIYLI